MSQHRPSGPTTGQSPRRATTEAPTKRRPRRVSRLIAVLALTAFAILGPATPAAADGHPPVDLAAVDRLVSDELAAASIPGAAIAITRGTQVLQVRGYGHDANDVPITANSRFRIASLSKSFTSLAVLQLVDAGRLSLDDPVVAHLPEFRLADPRGADITVRQLLDQTSGLADREVPELSRPQPSTLAEATTSLSSAHLVAAPGTQFNYHNPNYQVAARLVEVLSGQTFDAYLREHVFQPAGMSASLTTYTDDEPVANLADGHVVAYGHPIPVPAPATFEAGAGDVVSTAADMARWLVVQANGGRTADGTSLVSERSMTEMHTPSARSGYALGWDTDGPAAAPTRLVHSGNLVTFSAYQAVLPESGYGIALLFNSGSPFLRDQTAIFYSVLDLVEGTDPTSSRPRVTTATLDALLGCLTVLVLALGAHGALAARRWATRHARSRVHIVLGLAPAMAVLGLVAAFPDIVGRLTGGRDVNWAAAAYGWPALVVLLAAALTAATATLIARSWQLSQLVRNPADVPGRPASTASRLPVSTQKPVLRSHP
jgi:CubicO group peptidase (beta-lactamase class C family)